ncbi:type ISP restriction/modification enzyme [Rhizobium sp. L1K21]|uniref:type ISP restriction/modification enzyme n=1 Tax=Rhizobium sp. L1K21 TaxID=2954933 RepID=UPI0020922379|nr:type ISP restriction/modification enzyme [Rhizobium sp. L1K21]MCO6184596.1 N-6 DNA methylase [Rhizobium sp. L1K21]
MGDITAAELARVNSFPKLIEILENKLDWPINGYDLEDLTFEYEARELGLKPEETAKIREINQLRPLATNQPWGIFFISFEDKAISVTVLRRILRSLVVKKRAGMQAAERQAWDKHDLIFATSFGKSGERELAFIHFSDGEATNDLPVMKVLGWNAKDTKLHNEHVGKTLSEKFRWPDDPADQKAWRTNWSSAFELRPNETIRTSQDLAIRLAALATEIRARAKELLGAESDKGQMRTMLEAFRKNLIHDLDQDGFADMFAQTICYGMLAARISRPGADLVADNMADMVPKTNPFLKELFESFLKLGGRDKRRGMDFDELGVRDVVDMLNKANMEAVLRDFGDRNPKEDPVIHFYELFLKEYDPQKRMQRGVFYTPRPVVNFIVRAVDEILREEFGLPLGLADTTTWGELAAANKKIIVPANLDPNQPFVQILDPATGTGTFLVEVIDLINKRMLEHWKSEGKSSAEIALAWNAYVPKHLLPRLTAFELMMAPYSIAHMKVGLKLSETGYKFESNERARIFLTNALEPARDLDMEFIFMAEALAHEAQAANNAKAGTKVTIIVGNPPYSIQSQNLSSSARSWVDKYKYCDGKKIVERNSLQLEKNLQDDYIKFLSLSQEKISTSGFGIIGLITNHGFLDGATFRGVRQNILKQFSSIEIFDLHGNSTKREASPDGRSDENVFDIAQGVCVSIAVQYAKATNNTIKRYDIWGPRTDGDDSKYSCLLGGRSRIGKYQTVQPISPLYLFAPSSTNSAYESWPLASDLFGLYSMGIKTSRDSLVVGFELEEIQPLITGFVSPDLSDLEACEAFQVSAKKGWNLRKARSDVAAVKELGPFFQPFLYRPFDLRTIFYHSALVFSAATPVMKQLLPGNNLGLVLTRQTKDQWDIQATQWLTGHKSLGAYDANSVFPLMLVEDTVESFRRPNIDRNWALRVATSVELIYQDGILREKREQPPLDPAAGYARGDLTKTFGPRDLFDWIYAVLHAPSYRTRYVEFLKSDFPRIPTPGSGKLFKALVALGAELVALHLLKPDDLTEREKKKRLEDPEKFDPSITFNGTGVPRVETGYPKYEKGKVMINSSRWFEDVPKATWELHVGGYQVCEKWLKDRAARGGKKPSPGRVLTDEDIIHYCRIVVALTETRRIMAEIDKVIEDHGGWPDAFQSSQTGESK